ncbi:MAG TPA: NAD-dependent epimerase/dehydratase family protein [Gemmatimonadales bacterium]|nr:NAD-dependent epimerase/dehydratase family protein [Gemmatimonadales bacterium]
MTRLLVTGADGFVGRWLVQAALSQGDDVIAAISGVTPVPAEWQHQHVQTVVADLRTPEGVARVADTAPDAVIHLAAIASSRAVRQTPIEAWTLNAGATAALADALAALGSPVFLLVSTSEVYGAGHTEPIDETALPAPVSLYAATKLGAEIAAFEVRRRTGLPVLVARPFTHTGPGQLPVYVLPALAERLRQAVLRGEKTVAVGNLAPVRDVLDVRDVVRAYLLLLAQGAPGEVYNVATGQGRPLLECFRILARLAGSDAVPVADALLVRSTDIPVLVGDATRLRVATGWSPTIPLEQTLQELTNAQAH